MKKKLLLFLLVLFCAAAFAQDLSGPEPAEAESTPAPAPVFTTQEFRSLLIAVNFEPNSTNPAPASSSALNGMAALLRQSAHLRYEVHGHSCADTETQSSVMRLAAQRVESMVSYLQTSGIPARNIITIVNAPSDKTTAEGCIDDRRVDIMTIETRQVEVKPEPAPKQPVGATAPVARDVADVMEDGRRRMASDAAPAPITAIPSTPASQLAELAASQDKQALAIYMAGQEPAGARGVHNIMGGELARVISESDRYLAVDRTDAILEQLAREHTYQRSGAVDDDQIKALGQQLGVQYLCISDINAVGKRYYLDTRLVDVVTAEIIRSVTATSSLKDANEMARTARNIALELIEADKTREQRLRRKKIFRYTAIGLDVLGLGAIAYGVLENSNAEKFIDSGDFPDADRAVTRRDAAYIVGGSILAAGVTIHILF